MQIVVNFTAVKLYNLTGTSLIQNGLRYFLTFVLTFVLLCVAEAKQVPSARNPGIISKLMPCFENHS